MSLKDFDLNAKTIDNSKGTISANSTWTTIVTVTPALTKTTGSNQSEANNCSMSGC